MDIRLFKHCSVFQVGLENLEVIVGKPLSPEKLIVWCRLLKDVIGPSLFIFFLKIKLEKPLSLFQSRKRHSIAKKRVFEIEKNRIEKKMIGTCDPQTKYEI